jgi:hypothetical protein
VWVHPEDVFGFTCSRCPHERLNGSQGRPQRFDRGPANGRNRHILAAGQGIGQGPLATQLSRSAVPPPRGSASGHQERFAPPRLSASFGFSKPTFAATRRSGRDAQRAAVRTFVIGQPDPRRDNIITPEAGTLRNHLSLHPNRCRTRRAAPRLV